AASYEGHMGTVTLLLAKGADPNAQGGMYGTALQAASYRGHMKTIALLLDKGADPKAQGGEYGTALQAASDGGHMETVTLLLDKGAEHLVEWEKLLAAFIQLCRKSFIFQFCGITT
ncbi:ankyrin repeat-containing domain protein, partial [Mycena olivaceomarginata]